MLGRLLRTQTALNRHAQLRPKILSRGLNIHEYQSQQLMKQYGVAVPEGEVASTPEEAEHIARKLNSQDLIVKAQILAGGRGLGHFDNGLKGGVQICHSPEDVRHFAKAMLGHRLVTKQTGPEGKPVNKILVSSRYYNRRETYLAFLMDRTYQGPVMVGSYRGGTDIEGVAKENPDDITKIPINIDEGLKPEQARKMAKALKFLDSKIPEVTEQMMRLYKLFIEKDCTLVEVNPFVETSTGRIMSLDAKLNFDANASFKHKETFELEDKTQQDAREVDAAKHDLNYIGLDGNIGCLVNGAGLAMATMDIIKLYGGNPANFLDVGGGATREQVKHAIRILNSDPQVKAILINIFGGIMKCDTIAAGLISAAKELSLQIPLIVRLQGTNVDAGKEMIAQSGLKIFTAEDLDDAAQKAVKIVEILKWASAAGLDVELSNRTA